MIHVKRPRTHRIRLTSKFAHTKKQSVQPPPPPLCVADVGRRKSPLLFGHISVHPRRQEELEEEEAEQQPPSPPLPLPHEGNPPRDTAAQHLCPTGALQSGTPSPVSTMGY